jgi:hypothetical protein
VTIPEQNPAGADGEALDPTLLMMLRDIEREALLARLVTVRERLRPVLQTTDDHQAHQDIELRWSRFINLVHSGLALLPNSPVKVPDWLALNPADDPAPDGHALWRNRTMQMVRGLIRYLARAVYYHPAELAELADIEAAYGRLLDEAAP